MSVASENDSLLSRLPNNNNNNNQQQHQEWHHPHAHMEEYTSIGVAVVERGDDGGSDPTHNHEPVVLHDLMGPVLLETDATLLERHDSMYEVVSHVTTVDELPHEEDTGGQATIPSEIASMTKNLIGCGALSLCNGLALCANAPGAVWAGNLWILILGAIFGYFCWLIAKVCKLTGRFTYRGIWQETVGHKGSLAVSIFNGLKAALADLAYATILTDTLTALLLTAGIVVPRQICLLVVTVFCILPLCLLKNLHVLAPFSILGTAGIVFTAIAMAIRYFDGSYQPGGRFHEQIDPSLRPFFGTKNHAWSTAIFPFVCMTYEAYVMHYNAARFYSELKNRSLPRFGVAVSSSFSISALMYMAIASFGYLTFGGNSSGYILNNYSPYDPLAFVCRLAVGLAVLMAYPIVFFGVRDSVLDIFEVSLADQWAQNHGYLTLVLLSILTFVSVFVTDLGLINAIGGGLVTTPIVFLFPTIMYRRAVSLMALDKSTGSRLEITFTTGLTVLGAIFGLAGAWIAITQALSSSPSS